MKTTCFAEFKDAKQLATNHFDFHVFFRLSGDLFGNPWPDLYPWPSKHPGIPIPRCFSDRKDSIKMDYKSCMRLNDKHNSVTKWESLQRVWSGYQVILKEHCTNFIASVFWLPPKNWMFEYLTSTVSLFRWYGDWNVIWYFAMWCEHLQSNAATSMFGAVSPYHNMSQDHWSS